MPVDAVSLEVAWGMLDLSLEIHYSKVFHSYLIAEGCIVINSPWIFPFWIPKNWLAHKYMDCGKGSGIPYLVLSSPKVIFSPKELASPEQTATGKDNSNPFIVADLLINQMVISVP